MENSPKPGPFRLFYHPASSASMRVTLYLSCRGVPDSMVELVSTGLETDHRGILVFTMPEGDPETEKVGTTDLTAFNPEGRPVSDLDPAEVIERMFAEPLSIHPVGIDLYDAAVPFWLEPPVGTWHYFRCLRPTGRVAWLGWVMLVWIGCELSGVTSREQRRSMAMPAAEELGRAGSAPEGAG